MGTLVTFTNSWLSCFHRCSAQRSRRSVELVSVATSIAWYSIAWLSIGSSWGSIGSSWGSIGLDRLRIGLDLWLHVLLDRGSIGLDLLNNRLLDSLDFLHDRPGHL